MNSGCFLLVAALLSFQQEVGRTVDARLQGKSPRDSLNRFSYRPKDVLGESFVPNTNFWAKGIDLSCASPWNSAGGFTRAGTLISRRHIIFAKHFPLWKGVKIVFVGADGETCHRAVVKTVGIPGSDIMIGLLDADVLPSVKPARSLPLDVERVLGTGEGLPVGTLNQQGKLLLTELCPMPTNGTPWRTLGSRPSNDLKRYVFRTNIVGGDSGSPAFLLAGDEAVLLYCLTGGGCGTGPAVHLYQREIQKAMDELCPGYTLEVFDFSRMKSES